jgi:hypothetical protein
MKPNPRSGNAKPEQKPLILSPEQKMRRAQKDHKFWAAKAASPNLSPKAAHWARQASASAAAEVQLRQKAAEYAKTLSPQNPPISSGTNPPSSTKPGTSGSTT